MQPTTCCIFAGTPLGDSIELGAAAAVFLDARAIPPAQQATMTLLAAKSWVGHAEPAAGILGLAHAHLALHHHMQLPTLHLGAINPHVVSALERGPASGQFQILRQQACMLGTAGDINGRLRCGISAFAFQGTNAHAIIEQSEPRGVTSQPANKLHLQWQKSLHWIAPPAHALLTAALPQSSSITMVADLSSVRASQLVHGMLVRGTPVLSVDLYTELMAEAVQHLVSGTHHVQLQQLTSVAVPLQSHGSMTHPQQLVLKLTGAHLSVQHQVLDADIVCCQAVLVQMSMPHQSRAEPASRASPFLTALLTQADVGHQAAATAAVPSTLSQDQGFCFPGAVISAASQLQASFSSLAASAVIPTHVACLSLQKANSAELSLLTFTHSNFPAQLDASAAGGSCSLAVIQLSGIALAAAHDVLSGSSKTAGHLSEDVGMLYETQWKVSGPQPHAVTQTSGCCRRLGKHATDPVAACALLMATAQQAVIKNGSQKLSLQMTQGLSSGPCPAMSLALLRSAAQESSSWACSALITSPHNARPFTSAALPATTTQASAWVSKSDNGLVYEPRLTPILQQQAIALPSQAAAACIILGGTGSIGSLAALWSADRGVEEILMVGRTGKLSPASAANFATLMANQARDNGSIMITIAR